MAIALRDAAKKLNDVAVKSEIAAAVTLAGGLRGQRLSIRDFGNRFGLSDAAKQAVANEIRVPSLVEERFELDLEEFGNQVAYRSVELDSGGTLTAQSAEFHKVFHREMLDEADQKVRYSAEGKVVSEKLGKSR